MAYFGLSFLQAINMSLATIGHGRITAVPGASDPSPGGEAQYHLNLAIQEVIAEGHPSTTALVSFTASGGVISLSSYADKVLRVFGTGKHEQKEFSIQADNVYDPHTGSTACFGATETVILKLYTMVAAESASPLHFDNLAPDLKMKIARRAAQAFRAMKMPDQLADAITGRAAARADAVAATLEPTPDTSGLSPRFGEQQQAPRSR